MGTDEPIELPDTNRLSELWMFNPSVGGPIVRDKLWFFGSYSQLRADQFVALTYEALDDQGVYEEDLSRQAIDDQDAKDANVRITWQGHPTEQAAVLLQRPAEQP